MVVVEEEVGSDGDKVGLVLRVSLLAEAVFDIDERSPLATRAAVRCVKDEEAITGAAAIGRMEDDWTVERTRR